MCSWIIPGFGFVSNNWSLFKNWRLVNFPFIQQFPIPKQFSLTSARKVEVRSAIFVSIILIMTIFEFKKSFDIVQIFQTANFASICYERLSEWLKTVLNVFIACLSCVFKMCLKQAYVFAWSLLYKFASVHLSPFLIFCVFFRWNTCYIWAVHCFLQSVCFGTVFFWVFGTFLLRFVIDEGAAALYKQFGMFKSVAIASSSEWRYLKGEMRKMLSHNVTNSRQIAANMLLLLALLVLSTLHYFMLWFCFSWLFGARRDADRDSNVRILFYP